MEFENQEKTEKLKTGPEKAKVIADKTRNHLQKHAAAAEKLSDKRTINTMQPDETLSKNKKTCKYEKKADKKRRNLRIAKERIPQHRVFHIRYNFDENKNKYRHMVTLEKEDKKLNQSEGLAVSGIKKGAKSIPQTIGNTIHSEISKYEDENQTLKAAHMVEKSGESVLKFGVHTANKKIQEYPYTKVSKLKMESERLESKLSYHKAVTERNGMNKMDKSTSQKKAIKTAQQKANQKKNAVKTKKSVDKAAEISEAAARKLVTAIMNNKVAVIIVATALILIIMIQLFCGALCSSLSDTGTAIIATSFTSNDEDIRNAENYMKNRENQTLDFVNNISNWYVGWNEYNITTSPMNHDPYKLIAYLTAVNINFKFDNHTRDLIDEIFNELYTVNIEDITEIRTEEHEKINEEGAAVIVTTYYPYYILNVSITEKSWDSVVNPKLESANAKALYDLLYEKKGNKPTLF